MFYPVTDKSGLGGDERQSAGEDSTQCAIIELPAGQGGGEVNTLLWILAGN